MVTLRTLETKYVTERYTVFAERGHEEFTRRWRNVLQDTKAALDLKTMTQAALTILFTKS